jgi:hypothetical protein
VAVGVVKLLRLRKLRNVEHDGEALDRRLDEAVVQIETLGVVVQGVRKECPDPHLLGKAHRSQDGVFQQSCTYPPALPIGVNSQAAENRNRDRVRHVAPDTAWGLFVYYSPRGEAVIANDVITRRNDERSGRPFQLIPAGSLLEPVFEIWFGAAERVESVRPGQGARWEERGGP